MSAVCDLAARFAAYADDFERSYADGDWSRLARYFAEDAVYESFAPEPFAFRAVRRDAILARFAMATQAFDRRFDARSIEITSVSAVGERVSASGVATYTVAGAPPCRLPFTEIAEYRGDEIVRLEDAAAPSVIDDVIRWMADHATKLRPGLV